MLFFFCWGKSSKSEELSGVYLTNSGKNQEQLKIRKNRSHLTDCIDLYFPVSVSSLILKISVSDNQGNMSKLLAISS